MVQVSNNKYLTVAQCFEQQQGILWHSVKLVYKIKKSCMQQDKLSFVEYFVQIICQEKWKKTLHLWSNLKPVEIKAEKCVVSIYLCILWQSMNPLSYGW